MKPKGHKRGCKCVVCSPRTRRKRRRNHGYENQAATLHARRAAAARKNSTVPIGGTVRSRVAQKRLRLGVNPSPRSDVNREAVTELLLYIENTGELYPMIQAVQKSLMTKRARGDFDILKAGKAWMNVANRGAQMYTREYGTRGPHGSYGIFSPGTRSAVAGRLMSDFSGQAATGELDYLLPKKYQRKNPLRPWDQLPANMGGAVAGNPTAHYPRTKRGPKGKPKWYILDLFDGRGNLISSRYRKCARAKCAAEAQGLVNRKVGKRMVRKVELSGPYSRKPNAKTTRK